MPDSKQHLILLFDGTWNEPEDNTNVYRFCQNLEEYSGDFYQRFMYDPGVGTRYSPRFLGGIFGIGLDRHLMDGYDWLVRRYRPGSKVYIFGFSRGAYTARSLVGLLNKCGLVRVSTPALLKTAEKLYRNKKIGAEDERCRVFRERHSREIDVEFLGVWDTVGSLGIPGTMFSELDYYSWHNTRLSSVVKYAYHAVALDEHRGAFDTLLWSSVDGRKLARQKDVEQRWFIGSHSDVGGGANSPLADLPLKWLQDKAQGAGLNLEPFKPQPDAYRTMPKDSFRAYFSPVYRWYRRVFFPGDGRNIRHFNRGRSGEPAIGVTIDPSVWTRWREYPDYRPKTLLRAGVHPPGQEV